MSFEDFQKQVNQARAASEETRHALKTARQRAGGLERKKKQLLRGIGSGERQKDPGLAEITRSERKLAEAVRAGQKAHSEALAVERAKLNEFAQFTNPMGNIGALKDDWPILLLPLHLETRFKKVTRGDAIVNQLWVRVFPDDIAINSFESDLSETEIRDARAYWLARWKAGKDDVDGNRGAWRSLASAHGPGRAYWLISGDRYVPMNVAGEPVRAAGEIILAIGTEAALVEPEWGAIVAYWQAVWQAGKDRARLDQARNNLLLVVSAERASSLVKDYKPANLADPPPPGLTRDETVVRVEFVIFPKTEELETKLHAWSQPPTTSILPERFVLLAYRGGEQAIPPQLGNLVPPKLVLGPDPGEEQGEDLRLVTKEDVDANPNIHEGDLVFSENMRWMFDFDEAVAKGMGFKIDLSPELAAIGFDRIFVLGLKLGANKDKGQNLLEELFGQHQYSHKGLAILKQGTPTNNTEEDGSGYSWRHDPDDSFAIYFDPTTPRSDPTDWFGKTDGRWLAEMLGIDPAKLQTVENYYHSDIAEAKAMQRALWPATLGHFMDSLMNPVFSKNAVELTRGFFTRYVSGRGNVPAIRVGKQPYGILPATDYTHMQWFMPQPEGHSLSNATAILGSSRNFLVILYRILLDMDVAWTQLRSKVAYAGKEGDPHQILLDIVGLHPASVELYQRFANSLKQIHNIYNVKGFAHGGLVPFYGNSIAAAAGLLAKYGYVIDDQHPAPDILNKAFDPDSFFLGGDRIDKVPNSESAPIGIWTVDGKNYIGWLITAALDSHDRLRLQEGFIDGKPPTALLYLLLHHALDLSYIDTALRLFLSQGVMTSAQVQRAYLEPDLIHVQQGQETESRWKHLYTRDVRITGDPNTMVGLYIPQHIDTLDEAAAFRDVLAGLRRLKTVPTAALERLLMEHLDTVSYRYDAWVLGYLHLQLAIMRGLLHGDEPASPDRRGVYLGAYGWLEDVCPENKILTPAPVPEDLKQVFNPRGDLVEDNSNAGYVLAPSLNHAVTAAVLRNGHLSNEDPEEKEELKIKLSSKRVRMALKIIEGIQGGQTLAALLGYQFERGLHDRTDAEVDEFIFDLRNAFPLVAKKLKDTAPGPQDPEYDSIEQIEARNVLDGVAFLEHIEKTTATYPFGLRLPPASPAQEEAINQEVRRLIEVNDAVADLALAESVHQVVLGNYERAAATLDTYSKGNFPPTPDVIQTPRSGTQLTHRVALQFRTGLSHALGNPGVTPRMLAEPAMNDWMSGVMPSGDQIECVVKYVDRSDNGNREVAVNMSDICLAHIDMLYLLNVDNEQAMSALDDRVVHHIVADHTPRMDQPITIEYTRTLDAGTFSVFEMTSLMASLRALLLKSKPLNGADAKLSNEAAKENEQALRLDPNRVAPIVTALTDIRTHALADYITGLSATLGTNDVDTIVTELDTLISGLAGIFTRVSSFGIPQTGTGFMYQWCQSLQAQLRTKVVELITRWEGRRAEYAALRDEYMAGIGLLNDEELFAILRKAELKISSSATVPPPATPAGYFSSIDGTKFVQFEDALNNTISPILDIPGLSLTIQGIQGIAGQVAAFDAVGINIEEQLKQVKTFADDLKIRADHLSQEMQRREAAAGDFLAAVAGTGDSLAKVELVKNAAKAIFGDDMFLVPEFTLDAVQGTEWQNTLVDSEQSLRYLQTDLDMDWPMDDWLYGASRVREKLYHLENTLIHIEGFNGSTLTLVPSQFPYREHDYWLGMQFPSKKPGTEEPFTIDEDKLLFTSIYTEPFEPTRPQCGLLVDEWTEVIPSRDETAGLTFHYDQPNSEPPQSLLLVTPSRFTGHWRWDDVVATLHETLDMAKKRAVEPDHIDTTVYSRFLPPIVSLTSPRPVTALLNLFHNNLVVFAKVLGYE